MLKDEKCPGRGLVHLLAPSFAHPHIRRVAAPPPAWKGLCFPGLPEPALRLSQECVACALRGRAGEGRPAGVRPVPAAGGLGAAWGLRVILAFSSALALGLDQS